MREQAEVFQKPFCKSGACADCKDTETASQEQKSKLPRALNETFKTFSRENTSITEKKKKLQNIPQFFFSGIVKVNIITKIQQSTVQECIHQLQQTLTPIGRVEVGDQYHVSLNSANSVHFSVYMWHTNCPTSAPLQKADTPLFLSSTEYISKKTIKL